MDPNVVYFINTCHFENLLSFAIYFIISFSAWDKSRDSNPTAQKLEDMESTFQGMFNSSLYFSRLGFPGAQTKKGHLKAIV